MKQSEKPSEAVQKTDAEEKDVVLVLQTVDLPAAKRAGYDYGEPLSFTFPSELMHIFSAETEKNLLYGIEEPEEEAEEAVEE